MTRPFWTEEDIFLAAQRGYALFVQGRFEEATIIFEGLIAIDPSNVYCTNALAALWIRQGDAARAVELLDRILQMVPNDLDSRARRCEALLLLGRPAEARQDWDVLKRFSKPGLERLEILIEQAEAGYGSNFQTGRSITKDVKKFSS